MKTIKALTISLGLILIGWIKAFANQYSEMSRFQMTVRKFQILQPIKCGNIVPSSAQMITYMISNRLI